MSLTASETETIEKHKPERWREDEVCPIVELARIGWAILCLREHPQLVHRNILALPDSQNGLASLRQFPRRTASCWRTQIMEIGLEYRVYRPGA